MAKLVDEGMQQSAEDLVQLDEEILDAYNLDEILGLHYIAGHAGEPIRIDLLCREERRDGGDVAGSRRGGC